MILNRDILQYEGVPRHLWTTKCVTLYNNNGIAVAEEICQSIRYNIVIRIVGRLGEFHFAFQILKSLKEISFLTIGGTLFGLGQLCISFIMQRAYPITNDGISSSIETTFYRYVGYATIN